MMRNSGSHLERASTNINRIRLFSNSRSNLELLLMAMPGVLFTLIFAYLPMPGIILAFKNFKYNLGIFRSPWVYLDNFRYLFMTDSACRITRNTVVMNILFIVTGTVFSLIIALMLFELSKRWIVKTYQTIIIFPNFLSWVVVSFMFYGIMNPQYGLLNVFIQSLGKEAVDWYSKPEIWPLIMIITNLWKAGGMGSVIYYSVLMGIDKEYFEAAKIDGGNKLQVTRYITLPFLYPMITLLVILAIGSIIRADFGMFYTLTRDVATLYPTTDVIDTFVFRALRSTGDPGMAASAGLYQSLVGFVMIFAANYFVKKKSPENSLF
jgi:putative aldouronate transport system permease protein